MCPFDVEMNGRRGMQPASPTEEQLTRRDWRSQGDWAHFFEVFYGGGSVEREGIQQSVKAALKQGSFQCFSKGFS
jgi:hypothetical protein